MCYFCVVKKFLSNTLQRTKYSKHLPKRLEGAMSLWPVSYIHHRLHVGLKLQ